MADKAANPIHLYIPPGTQVVTRLELRATDSCVHIPRDSVGVIVATPEDGNGLYRVRFLDGAEADYKRSTLSIRKQFQSDVIGTRDAGVTESLYEYVIYRCIVGSRAYGLDHTESDTDYRGIYLPPANLHWSLHGVPEQLENEATQECYWELQKFIVMAIKANPNVLECLYTPLVVTASPMAQELLDMRSIFLSKLIYQTYNGYVMSQFRKLEQDLRAQGEFRWPHAMHLIRLLLSAITILREGFVPVGVGDKRETLLAIRRGEMPWDEVNRWRLSLHRQLRAEFDRTTLPERPDVAGADAFLVKARRAMQG